MFSHDTGDAASGLTSDGFLAGLKAGFVLGNRKQGHRLLPIREVPSLGPAPGSCVVFFVEDKLIDPVLKEPILKP